MFICKQVKGASRVILEVTPERLDTILARCSKAGSQASQDATLMALTNGLEVTSTWGAPTLWYRVEKPMPYSPAPAKCDISQRQLGDVMYDGKVNGHNGQWAIMDEQSWEHYGCGRIGTGFAQKYLRGSDGQFYASEGMAHVRRYGRSAI